MGVSKNSGTPKSSSLIGFSIINHPFWGPSPIFGNTHIYIYILIVYLFGSKYRTLGKRGCRSGVPHETPRSSRSGGDRSNDVIAESVDVEGAKGAMNRVEQTLDIQSYLLRFGVLGRFLGSEYLLRRCLDV